jgi:hypothetical protein
MMEIYPTYKEREETKRIGWEKIEKTADPKMQAYIFIHYIVLSHYWRAREAIDASHHPKQFLRSILGKKYYKFCQLQINDYASHWLWANSKLVPPETILAIEEIFGYKPEENKLLPESHTNYLIPS